MRVSSQQNYDINFKAQLISQWRCSNLKNNAKNISVVSIEKRDLEFMRKFLDFIHNVKSESATAKEIMIDATQNIIEILSDNRPKMDRIKMFIATYNNKPCGILVANIPKIIAGKKESIVFSSRHNLAKNETEIDWLVTWNPTGNQKLKGIGKALVGEYFRTVKKDRFRDVFVRSEVPEKSFATFFYESLGFESSGLKRLKLSNKNSAQTVIKDYGVGTNDDTIPMIITRSRIGVKAKELAQEMNRKEFKKNSEEAEILINI